jgi:hypothetical protein
MQEMSWDNMDRQVVRCPRTMSNEYEEHFRGALESSQLGLPRSTVLRERLKLRAHNIQLVYMITCKDHDSRK